MPFFRARGLAAAHEQLSASARADGYSPDKPAGWVALEGVQRPEYRLEPWGHAAYAALSLTLDNLVEGTSASCALQIRPVRQRRDGWHGGEEVWVLEAGSPEPGIHTATLEEVVALNAVVQAVKSVVSQPAVA